MIDNFKKYMELILNGHLLHSYYARIQGIKLSNWIHRGNMTITAKEDGILAYAMKMILGLGG